MSIKHFTVLLLLLAGAGYSFGNTIDSSTTQTEQMDIGQIKNSNYFYQIADQKRVVFLGEEDHKVAEFNQLKTQIINNYRAREPRVLLLFESAVDAAFYGFRDNMNSFLWPDSSTKIFPLWINAETEDLLIPSQPGHSFLIGGIDPQHLDDFYEDYQKTSFFRHFQSSHFWSDSFNNRLLQLDAIRFSLIKKRGSLYTLTKKATIAPKEDSLAAFKNYTSDCKQLLADYKRLLENLPVANTVNEKIDRLVVLNRPWEIEVSIAMADYSRSRNEMMARNLTYLADSVFADWKIIVWAHDGHVLKQTLHDPITEVKATIGTYLSKSFMDESAVFLLKTNRHILNDGTALNKTKIASSETVHQYMAAGNENQFFSPIIDASLWSKQFKRCYWDTNIYKCNYRLSDVCDGIFYLKDTHTPHFQSRYMRERRPADGKKAD
ncbi:erythromycin esterase family protein [Taibaiella soli]|nr:erythromycin esterase family protein [Taibaiella soli]